MAWRLLPFALVLAAAVADARELHLLAFYVLVAAVAVAAVSALSVFGELVERADAGAVELYARAEVLLGAVGLVCVLVAAATRGQAGETAAAPAPAVSALVAALTVYALQAVGALYRPPRPVRASELTGRRTGPSRYGS
jgi:hypothetical protein